MGVAQIVEPYSINQLEVIAPEQLRAARGLLDWTRADLSNNFLAI